MMCAQVTPRAKLCEKVSNISRWCADATDPPSRCWYPPSALDVPHGLWQSNNARRASAVAADDARLPQVVPRVPRVPGARVVPYRSAPRFVASAHFRSVGQACLHNITNKAPANSRRCFYPIRMVRMSLYFFCLAFLVACLAPHLPQRKPRFAA